MRKERFSTGIILIISLINLFHSVNCSRDTEKRSSFRKRHMPNDDGIKESKISCGSDNTPEPPNNSPTSNDNACNNGSMDEITRNLYRLCLPYPYSLTPIETNHQLTQSNPPVPNDN